MEAPPNMGATVVVSPFSDDRVDRLDQFAQTQGYLPLRQGPRWAGHAIQLSVELDELI